MDTTLWLLLELGLIIAKLNKVFIPGLIFSPLLCTHSFTGGSLKKAYQELLSGSAGAALPNKGQRLGCIPQGPPSLCSHGSRAASSNIQVLAGVDILVGV